MDKDMTGRFITSFGDLMKLTRPKRYGSYTRGEMRILSHLYDKAAPVQPGELSGVMEASSARVAAALRRLEAKGQIARTADAADRRRIFVRITDAGRSLVEARRREVHDYVDEILAQLGEDDFREGMRILERITEIVEALEDNEDSALDGKGGNDLADTIT